MSNWSILVYVSEQRVYPFFGININLIDVFSWVNVRLTFVSLIHPIYPLQKKKNNNNTCRLENMLITEIRSTCDLPSTKKQKQ